MLSDQDIHDAHWKKTWEMPNTQWTLKGYSRAAYRTGFYIPELNIMLDAGPQNFNKPDHIFITHTHFDHICGLPLTMIGDEHGKHIFNIYAPAESEKFIRSYINSGFSLNACHGVNVKTWYEFHPMKHTLEFITKIRKKPFQVETFECIHKVPTVGYGFSQITDKLKPEYSNLEGREIGKLRKEGVEITYQKITKKFAYVCDSTIEVLEKNKSILKYPIVIIECTFIVDDESTCKDHIYWSDLEEYVKEYTDVLFVLIHFSRRYKDKEIKEFFEKKDYKNIKVWI